MRLFDRYKRLTITASIFSFLIGSIGFYFVLTYVLTRQLDETLKSEQQEILAFVQVHNSLPEIQNTRHQWITVQPAATANEPARFGSTSQYLPDRKGNKEEEIIRQLSFTIAAGGKHYLITVNKSATETEDLLQLIVLVTICMVAILLLWHTLLQRRLLKRIWQPFYDTVERMRQYNIAGGQLLELPEENVEEFKLLHDSLNQMTQRIYQDYQTLRAFTENASHEMQTPLAVIRSGIDNLLQNAEGQEAIANGLSVIETATDKLAKLNQSLLLLAKLENRHFLFTEDINITEVLQNKLREREEAISAKQLLLHTELGDACIISFHRQLAEILVTNLLNNGIRHSKTGGYLRIRLSGPVLSIRNTAYSGALDNQRIFQRFYKTDPSSEGTGLGLAIVREICTAAGLSIQYAFNENEHVFTIVFNQGQAPMAGNSHPGTGNNRLS